MVIPPSPSRVSKYNYTKMLLVLLTVLPGFTVSINLSSTQNGEGACFGDVLIFRCTLTGSGTLVWYLGTVRVRLFTALDEPGSEPGLGLLPDVANVTLVNVDKDPINPVLGNLTSDLTVVVSNNTIEKYVNCSNGRKNQQEILIKKQLVPSPIIIKENITGGIGEYSFRLQLQAQNRLYSLSLYNDVDTLVMNFTAEGSDISIPGLKYNTRYSLVISNVNCFNEENTTTLEISQAGCRAPPSPVNGSIEEYRSTEEGAEIQFHCHDGYTPNEMMSSQCLNSSWSPHPMDLLCTNIMRTSSPIGPSSTSHTSPSPTIASESIEQQLAAGLVSGLLFAIVCVGIIILVVCGWRRFTRLKVTHSVHGNTCSGMPLAQYSVIERRNLGTELHSDPPVGQYSVVQSGSPQHEIHFNGASQMTGNGVSVSGVAPPIPHHSPVQTNSKGLVYAKVNPTIPAVPPPKTQDGQRVTYVTVWADAVVPPLPSDTKKKADVSVSLDQILIQLGEVAPDWRRLAESLEIEGVDDIAQYVSSEHDAMVEVVDGWLRKLYPKVPTWREIADVVEGLGYCDLAYCLRQVYVTGFLPIEVSNSVSPTVPVGAIPPPVPPRLDHEPLPPRDDQPSSPCLSLRQDQPSLLLYNVDQPSHPLENDNDELPPPLPPQCFLPIEVSNSVSPTVPISASPPPVPPRLDHEPLPPHDDQPSSPCLSLRQDQPSLLLYNVDQPSHPLENDNDELPPPLPAKLGFRLTH